MYAENCIPRIKYETALIRSWVAGNSSVLNMNRDELSVPDASVENPWIGGKVIRWRHQDFLSPDQRIQLAP